MGNSWLMREGRRLEKLDLSSNLSKHSKYPSYGALIYKSYIIQHLNLNKDQI